jgi:4-hydroxythreonine-4-phosphate dehydrogenase
MGPEIKRILITPGEPAGIGPDITIAIASASWDAELIAIADPKVLYDRARQLGLPLTLVECDLNKPSQLHTPHTLQILPIKCDVEVTPGTLDEENASYVIKTLESAASICLDKKANAIVTGPVHKGIINHARIPFTGHTEFFADFCQIENTVMLFVVDDLKIALATTHLPLAKVPEAVTCEHLTDVLSTLNEGLKKYFSITCPTIFVSGLNPHAGENGHLGREEIETIAPVIIKLREQGLLVYGPFPADTLFTQKYLEQADAFLAMYHDQALPLVKYIGFDHAVNVTLGLPFLRTSVDHGTALDIAGKGKASPGSMIAAIQLAINLSH